jgi:hypothetical protein
MKGAFLVGVISSGETAAKATEVAKRKAQRGRMGRVDLTLPLLLILANAKPLVGAGF